ncbi:5'-3' exoribonuclease pacman isoform X2 [Andrena cerasifolii]|uniref:5'-3' exoribonuclease pacman isoform X2 n=1 Tax=Andrena cerasifolii TaxID=2819439 RepID=UPI0040381BB4
MGVPKFFRHISERYPCTIETLKEYQIPDIDNLYLDTNGILHICSHPNDNDVSFRTTEEAIFKNIFRYIEVLFNKIQPRKLFFIAIDGVAPRAKINHQRSRRFRSAKDVELLEAKAKAQGIEIPKEKMFDSNCITPGTVFMSKVDEQLKYFITYKISTDNHWQKCKVMFSGSQVPGEGEHKIMDYIRYTKSQPDYDPHTRHCLYGLDADLIMLGLCTHEMHFILLREEVMFDKKERKIVTPEEIKFCLFHLSLLKEYINHEFSVLKDKLSFPYDIEKIVDDWILMGFLVGNDFIPHLPNLHIKNDALAILYHVYIDVLPTLEGYINESGTLKLDRFERFMERLSRFDTLQFAEHYADLKYLESKSERRFTESVRPNRKKLDDGEEVPPPKRAQDKEFDVLLRSIAEMSAGDDDGEDDESDSEIYNLEFVQHKREYYMNKLEYENIDEDFLRDQAEGYIRGVQWNLNYYYNGCCSWSWYYPHHYAPYISDIKNFKDLKLEFDLGEPFLPFQQLLAVLPPYSKELLPSAFQLLLTDETSPVIDYYPLDFDTDLNGKIQDWEAVVLIPFIDEKRLLDAMAPYYDLLTPEERARNKHGPMRLYSYTEESLGTYKAPEYFCDVVSHANVRLINRDEIIVAPEKLVKGLCPNVQLDVYHPGFPTLQYVKHTAALKKAEVRVFQRPTRKESMILHVTPPPEPNLSVIASELLGKIVFVNWPHLTEAQVTAVSNSDTKISLINPQSSYSYEKVKEEEWNVQKILLAFEYKVRRGVDIGETNILVHARPLIDSVYTVNSENNLCLVKQWAQSQKPYAYQVIVKDITVYGDNSYLLKTLHDIFVPGTVCFMLGHPHYGSMGNINDPAFHKNCGSVRITVNVTREPSLDTVKQFENVLRLQYMKGGIAAQRLGISSYLLSKITGTIYVQQSSDEFREENHTKYNLGLNLKFNKKNEEVPDYTRKENGQWMYSTKTIDLIRRYMVKYPLLFERLAQNVTKDIFQEESLFDKDTGSLKEIIAWLKEQLQGVESRACDTEILNSCLIKKLEEEIDEFHKTNNNPGKLVPMEVRSHMLFIPGLNSRKSPPDLTAYTLLWDRVCCIRNSFTVPLGYRGTVIGIQKAENYWDTMYYVLFDKPFPGGLSIQGCSEYRGYCLSPIDLINISHGERQEYCRSRDGAMMPRGYLRAGSSAFASYEKNEAPPEPATAPKLRIQKNNRESAQDNHLSLAPENISKWKRCDSQNATNVREDQEPAVNAQQNAQKKQPAKPSIEFQALWNELHKPQTASEPAKTVAQASTGSKAKQVDKGSVESFDPSAFLKAMLKISDESTRPADAQASPSKTILSNTVPQTENKVLHTPPLVQQLFDHARQNEQVKDEKTPAWYCSQLLTYYQPRSVGMPKYSYFKDGETNLIRAHILLPDKRVFVGDPCVNHEHAAGSAAKKVCTELYMANVLPNMKTLMPPPQHWYFNRQNSSWTQVIRPPGVPFYPFKPQPPQIFPQWTPEVQHNSGYQQAAPQNNQYTHHAQQKPAQSEAKPEIKNSTPFVPLQAQKKSRNSSAKQNDGKAKEESQPAEHNLQAAAQQKKKGLPAKPTKAEAVAATAEKQKPAQNSSHQVHSTPSAVKPRKSRIAAKFGITEEGSHSTNST